MIDPRAYIDPKAELDSSVQVGAFSYIGAGVQIDAGTKIEPHVVIKGTTRIGRNNRIHQFAALGDDPQDKKYRGTDTRLEIGDDNVIREYCTMHRGTEDDEGITSIGNDNWIMAYTHFAHDSRVGNHTIFANGSSLAGHVIVADYVILGGFSLVHQFCQLGAHSFSGAGTVIFKDVPPFVTVWGNTAKAYGINKEGLKRRNFSPEAIRHIQEAYKIIYRQGLTLTEAIEALKVKATDCAEINLMIDFLGKTTRGIVR
ncbi:acyl-(acyl-carrier-protein)--UDP-N-acetylglucosamine O-acyltransferase [Beggiatoa alba B18LD]|uniref:Acyl-[acyl-carrier-protein]--UDP-N-acetylglucosamine O-acyltransferase n=1 Tax=Beggiatoa alba B18LD TaxID=395493 RepID=I3CKE7_9GAMM|nr:acyl-ACP--UDP-N-acetylglucosamine O-acyltransferase [Beggiatoa alba]EIJ44090.1 acyl-(acyl-carrier-protein)--UDP-N-acetylglucosamine O-acyltransferase [Beggiatoa alba B18LD]